MIFLLNFFHKTARHSRVSLCNIFYISAIKAGPRGYALMLLNKVEGNLEEDG